MITKLHPHATVYHRNDLAFKLAKRILSITPGATSQSGLFLSAPRRTGKSTFLREDLRPALLESGSIVIYADLWEDKQVDPSKVIISSIRSEITKHDGVIKRLAKSAGMDKVNLGPLNFSLDRIGLSQDVSITAALTSLSDELKQPIVLIIDEAQHAISTKDGNDTLFALKAARDELNSSNHYGLHIVATGSSQAKLAMLRNSKDQAFFGAFILEFPHLNKDYVSWFCDHQDFGAQLDVDAVMDIFTQAGFRPEILGAAAATLKYDLDLEEADVARRFTEEVQKEIKLLSDTLRQVINSLTPIQYAVLKVMAESGNNYAPFEAKTLVRYSEVLNEKYSDISINTDVTTVQQALNALQDKSLVWKESRGIYALEDPNIAEIFNFNNDFLIEVQRHKVPKF